MLPLLNAYRKLRYKKSYRSAVKQANHVRYTRGYKCYVLFFDKGKGFTAITKQAVRQLWKAGYFKKGVTMQEIENMAVYVTK